MAKSATARQGEAPEQISERKLRQLLKDKRTSYKDMREIAGTIGEKIRQAQEHDHLHPKAFRIAAMCDLMEPEKLADFLDALDYYLGAGGLRERAASAPRMEMEEGNVEEFPSAAE